MSQIQLYIATSIDGYIARKDGALDWLDAIPMPEGHDYGYQDFYDEVDTVVMGRDTYEIILGFDVPWPYADRKTYVFTKNKTLPTPTPNTKLLHELTPETIQFLRKKARKNIWLSGGGNLISQFLSLNAIDSMIITIIPVVLGSGLPLFPNNPKEAFFELETADAFSTGAVNLVYKRKK